MVSTFVLVATVILFLLGIVWSRKQWSDLFIKVVLLALY
jgi:hypothetical protein